MLDMVNEMLNNNEMLDTGCQFNLHNVRSIDVLCLTLRCCYSVITRALCKLNSASHFSTDPKKATEFLKYTPSNIYLLKVNSRNTRERCEMYSKLPIKTPERRQ